MERGSFLDQISMENDRDLYQIRETFLARKLVQKVIPVLIRHKIACKVTSQNRFMLDANREDPEGENANLIGKTFALYSGTPTFM